MSDELEPVEVVKVGRRWEVTCQCGAELRFGIRSVRYSYRGEGLQYGTTGERVIDCPECERPVVVEYLSGVAEAYRER